MPELSESLLYERELTIIFNDRYAAVSVVKDDIIIGHLSRQYKLWIYNYSPFLLRNGTVDCTIDTD